MVTSVYSGRPGCACGCLGTYKYTKQHQKEQGKRRGYVVEDSEVSERSVSYVTNKINKFLRMGGSVKWRPTGTGGYHMIKGETPEQWPEEFEIMVGDTFISLEVEGRTVNTLYIA